MADRQQQTPAEILPPIPPCWLGDRGSQWVVSVLLTGPSQPHQSLLSPDRPTKRAVVAVIRFSLSEVWIETMGQFKPAPVSGRWLLPRAVGSVRLRHGSDPAGNGSTVRALFIDPWRTAFARDYVGRLTWPSMCHADVDAVTCRHRREGR